MMKEIKEISNLFKLWLKEFTWSNEDANYMHYIINISE